MQTMASSNIEAFAALDFEASSLTADSWPIEVGVSWVKGNRIRTWSSLIRPASGWDLLDWSTQSEAVHGIPISTLEAAPDAADVAAELMSKIEGFTLVSDAPEFEHRWLSRLLDAAGISAHPVIIEDFDAVSFAHYDGIALDLLYEKLERTRVPHRAGPDSARLASGWLKARQVGARSSKDAMQ